MDQGRFDEAMGRLSQAMKRVEKAAEALVTRPVSPGSPADGELRARVAAALGDLDELIGSLER